MNPIPGKWIESDAFQNTRPKLVLLGDSILDNFYWLADPKQSLAIQLQELLSKEKKIQKFGGTLETNYQVINLAVDQHTTFDLECRTKTNPWGNYAKAKEFLKTEPNYFSWSNGNLYSFKTLALLKNVKYIFLSIGGNDVYLVPHIIQGLIKSIRPKYHYLRSQIATDFQKRYTKILHEIKFAAPQSQICGIIPYHPAASFSMAGAQKGIPWFFSTSLQAMCLSRVVTPIVRALLNCARAENIHVIDLSHSFNRRDDSLYGTGDWKVKNSLGVSFSGVEPSNKGSLLIAKHILFFLSESNFWKQKSCVFSLTENKTFISNNSLFFEKKFKFGK